MPNSDRLIAHLQLLADFPGVDGCALVETATRMAWHVAGNHTEIERIGEAAIESWRVQHRLSAHLTTLGTLKLATYSFANQVVALLPCCDEPGLVLFCLAANGPIAWPAWGVQVEAICCVVAQSLLSQYRSVQR